MGLPLIPVPENTLSVPEPLIGPTNVISILVSVPSDLAVNDCQTLSPGRLDKVNIALPTPPAVVNVDTPGSVGETSGTHADCCGLGIEPRGHARQSVGPLAPAELYVPGWHCISEADVEPPRQNDPAAHRPEHAAVVRPAVAPYVPAGQRPEHVALVSPDVEP